MPESDERLVAAEKSINLAEGYIRDAEFREDPQDRTVRFLQAIACAMMALYQQNLVIIDAASGKGRPEAGRV